MRLDGLLTAQSRSKMMSRESPSMCRVRSKLAEEGPEGVPNFFTIEQHA